MKTKIFVTIILLLSLSISVSAYSGYKLSLPMEVKDGGTRVNDTLQFTYKLYDAPTGGNLLYTKIVNETISDGIVNAEMSSLGAVDVSKTLYLSITIGTTTLSPRIEITPAVDSLNNPWNFNGTTAWPKNASTQFLYGGSELCTAGNGLCRGTNGWSSDGVETSTSLDVNVSGKIYEGNNRVCTAQNNFCGKGEVNNYLFTQSSIGQGVNSGYTFNNSNYYEIYNANNTDGLSTVGFWGSIIAGNYVYYIPLNSGKVLRYDRSKEFNDSTAWEAYDAGNTDGEDSTGYAGGAFDGRYIYFSPYKTSSSVYHGVVLRYDTLSDFKTGSSWSTFDITNLDSGDNRGYRDATFDGRYVYFAPLRRANYDYHAQMIRYDTKQDFSTSSSWKVYDASSTDGYTSQGYKSLAYCGRHIYYAPNNYNGVGQTNIPLRYDTSLDFNDSTAWEATSLPDFEGYNTRGYSGVVCDNRYVYYVPIGALTEYHSRVLRYDMEGDFQDNSSWSVFDGASLGGSNQRGYLGAVSDGRNIYFVPYYYGPESGGYFMTTIMKYDTTRDFNNVASWELFDMNQTSDFNLGGYAGGAFDGRYIYYAPYAAGTSSSWEYTGYASRFDTKSVGSAVGIQHVARSSEMFINSAGDVGFGTVSPTQRVSVQGNVNVSGNITSDGSQVCTVGNGLCDESGSAAGWTNTSTTTKTTLKVGIGATPSSYPLEITTNSGTDSVVALQQAGVPWRFGVENGANNNFKIIRSGVAEGLRVVVDSDPEYGFDTYGKAVIGGDFDWSLPQFTVFPYNSSTVGAAIRGAASQSANLQEWQNNAGSTLGYVTPEAYIKAGECAGGYSEGDMCYNSTNHKMYVYDGSTLTVLN